MGTVVDVYPKVSAATREAAVKKITPKAKKNIWVHCNPYYQGEQRIPYEWRCEVSYAKVKR